MSGVSRMKVGSGCYSTLVDRLVYLTVHVEETRVSAGLFLSGLIRHGA